MSDTKRILVTVPVEIDTQGKKGFTDMAISVLGMDEYDDTFQFIAQYCLRHGTNGFKVPVYIDWDEAQTEEVPPETA